MTKGIWHRPCKVALQENDFQQVAGKMENSVYIGLSRQMALSHQMDMIANNVANADTPGFRAQNLTFKEYLSHPRGMKDKLSFVYDSRQYSSPQAGPARPTGNPLDVMLNGNGFLGVRAPDGARAYSRAGNFHLSPAGELENGAGLAVLDAGGSPIAIPADSQQITIDSQGIISNQGGQIGRLMVMEFKDMQSLKPIGNTAYVSSETGTPATQTTVQQGFVEGSNVQPVVEMTRMVDVLRSFQGVQNILDAENERLRGAIEKLTRQS